MTMRGVAGAPERNRLQAKQREREREKDTHEDRERQIWKKREHKYGQ